MADKKISEMTTASQINNEDNIELSQGSAGSGFASVKATILAIAQKIITGINFTSALETESKTIAGAINEVAQGGGGSSTFAGLSDVDIDDTTLANGQVPKWNSTTEKWENGNAGGGSGGHTILDDSGTSLAQEDDLQFKGTYSHDDSTNGKTVVEITREMTQAEYNLLSADKKKGIIRITDDNYVCEGSEVKYAEGVSVNEKIDEVESVENLTITGSVTDAEGQHFIKNGIAYFFGNMRITQNLVGGLIGTFNVSVYGGNNGIGQWIGYNKTRNETLIGGYLQNNQIVCNVGTVQNGDLITMFTTFRVEP